MKRVVRRCKVEHCDAPAAPDVPVCLTHWRTVSRDLRHAYMGIARRVVRAAEDAEVQP